jgi:crotonobetainyl-CoA:carnitine CoA-transferase CaiB-like acyl-CoA transferase
MTGPLAGIQVVEIANYITGPYAGLLLADLGADVIKIEDPRTGDPFRTWGNDLYAPHFVAFNRSKRSLTLDLKQPDGLAVLRRLLATADVLIENFRPGVAERLGFGSAAVQVLNPRLIYCSISGTGQTGPSAHRPTFDTVGQSLSGLLSLLLNPTDPRPVGPALSDSLTGLFAGYAILAALHARQQTGKGQRIETSLLQATMGFLLEPYGMYFGSGQPTGPTTRQEVAQVYVFDCQDQRRIALHLSSPIKFWLGLLEATGRQDLAADPRFAQRTDRIRLHDEIQAELAPTFRSRTQAHWLAALEKADVPCAPVYTLDQVLQDAQVQHLGMVQNVVHPTQGPTPMLGFPVRFGETDLEPARPAPTLGEQRDEILRQLGYGPGEVDELQARGVI